MFKLKSGVICVAVKSYLNPYITIIETDNVNVLWFVVSGKLCQTGDILYGVVYVPPEYSEYATVDPYSDIQNDLDFFSNRYKHVCIFGDWNSRTKQLLDYIDADYDIYHEHDLDDVYFEIHNNINGFSNTNVCVNRRNMDTGVNNYGYKFIGCLHCNDF